MFLRDHPDEVQALQRELLISVTHFFRDPEAFAVLEHTIVPRLFHNKYAQDQVRVWVAGCATGEEAYSIAMLLAEAAGACADPPVLQVFATDLDASAIADAREGCYSDADVADVSPERLRRFFVRETATSTGCAATCARRSCSRITTCSRIRRSRISTSCAAAIS